MIFPFKNDPTKSKAGTDAINIRSELYLMKMMVNIQMAERAIGVT